MSKPEVIWSLTFNTSRLHLIENLTLYHKNVGVSTCRLLRVDECGKINTLFCTACYYIHKHLLMVINCHMDIVVS